MPQAHGDAPVRHRAGGIVLGDLQEFFLRFLVPEGVQQRDSAGEGLLHGRRTRNGKVDGSELSLGEVFVVWVIFVLVVVSEGCEGAERDEKQKTR